MKCSHGAKLWDTGNGGSSRAIADTHNRGSLLLQALHQHTDYITCWGSDG